MPLSRRRPRSVVCFCALLAVSGGCADLQIIPADECGNDVLEPELGEECDGEADCGAPGTEHACRVVCPDGVCRAGRACGLDGVCRAPAGAFEVLSATATTTAVDLFTGDVNVDGCDELFVSSRQGTTLTAFESRTPGACPASTQEIPSGRAPEKGLSRPAPLFADMDRDGRPDLVRAAAAQYDDALFVDLGGPTPRLASILYPTVKALEAPARSLRVTLNGEDALLLFLDSPMGTSMIGVAGVLDPKNTPRPSGAGLPGVMEDLVVLSAADLNEVDPACDPCDEVLAGFAGQSEIFSLGLSKVQDPMLLVDAIAATMPLPAIALPGGAKLRKNNASMAVVDHDGDGHLDVIVNTETGNPMGQSALLVAYGNGKGQFHSTTPPSMDAPDGMASELPPPPAGSMDLDARSGQAIFVAAYFDDETPGVELQAIPCLPSVGLESIACHDTGKRGCEAVVFDIDADGRLDVVSTEEQQPGLSVRRKSTAGGFHLSFVDTSCPPHALATGDFDDNGVTDVAFFDQTLAGSALEGSEATPVDTLMIAYGNPYAAPDAPLPSGRFADAQGLTAGRFSPEAVVTQLYATRDLDETAKSGFALIEGYGERRLFAPYYLPYPPEENGGPMSVDNIRTVAMIAAGAGRFSKDPETGEPLSAVALVTRDTDAEGAQVLQLVDARSGGSSLIEADAGESPTCEGCLLVPIDVPECPGEGGPDELLLLGQDELIVYSVVTTGEQSRFAFQECARFTETGHAFSFVDPEPKPEKYAPRPLVADLDRDGRTDVLARDSAGDLIALWGRAGGGFDLVKLELPEGGGAVECGRKCAAALLDADGDDENGRELFVAAPGALRLYRVRADRSLGELPVPAGLQDFTPAKNTDFTAVVAADLDGDGIQDMALMPSSGLLVTLRGLPVKE